VRQRPGTAKGFVFLSLEDETGIANIIVNPQIFETNRLALVNFPFLLIEGALQTSGQCRLSEGQAHRAVANES